MARIRWHGGGRAGLVLIAAVALAGCDLTTGRVSDGSRGETDVNLRTGRYAHTETVLHDGSVLIVGGIERQERGERIRMPSTMELLDAATGAFRVVGDRVLLRRAYHAAVYSDAGTPDDAEDDFVLVAGGFGDYRKGHDPLEDALDSIIRIRTGDGSFAVEEVGALPTAAAEVCGTALPGGLAAFTGGADATGVATGTLLICAPDGVPATATTLLTPRWNHRSVFVPNGRAGALVTMGGRDEDDVVADRELLDLETYAVASLGSGVGLQMHTLTVLDGGTAAVDDDVLVEAGGLSQVEEDIDRYLEGHLDEVRMYRLLDGGATGTATLSSLGTALVLPEAVFRHAAAATADGTALVIAGGFTSLYVDRHGYYTGFSLDSAPTRRVLRLDYAPATSTLTAVALPDLRVARALHTLSVVPSGDFHTGGGLNRDVNSVRGSELIARDGEEGAALLPDEDDGGEGEGDDEGDDD